MESANVDVVLRTDTGKGAARKLRHAGKVPGVLYVEGGKSQPIVLDSFLFETLRRSGAHHRLLDLNFADGTPTIKALLREMQIHPVSRAVLHVDLQRVNMEKRVHVTVPIVLVGKPEGVKTQGGILEHHLRDVEDECLPTDIPEEIRIEVGEASSMESAATGPVVSALLRRASSIWCVRRSAESSSRRLSSAISSRWWAASFSRELKSWAPLRNDANACCA